MAKGKRKKKLPPVRLVAELGPILEQLKSLGLFRCHVLDPDCSGQPYAEVERAIGDKKIRSLFCMKHAIHFCQKEGHRLPLPVEN